MNYPPSPQRAALWAWVATFLLAALLGALTLSPSVPSVGPATNDKVQHFIGFALLAAPLGVAYPRRILAVIFAAVFFGAMIELVQPFVGRDREGADLIADALGAVFGGTLARVWALRRARVR